MEIIPDKNAAELAGKALEALFKEAGASPVLFLSSGGSVLGILDIIDKKILGSNFTIGVVDERFSTDPAINNFLQLKLKLDVALNANWIDSVPEESDELETLANRMGTAWRKWRSENPTGKVIITMGMGVDGHTAGIMPNMERRTFHIEPRRFHIGWVVGYDVGVASLYSMRITATFEFLRSEVDFAIVYISGEEKRQALERILVDSGSLAETPARIFREMKNVKIFTDIG